MTKAAAERTTDGRTDDKGQELPHANTDHQRAGVFRAQDGPNAAAKIAAAHHACNHLLPLATAFDQPPLLAAGRRIVHFDPLRTFRPRRKRTSAIHPGGAAKSHGQLHASPCTQAGPFLDQQALRPPRLLGSARPSIADVVRFGPQSPTCAARKASTRTLTIAGRRTCWRPAMAGLFFRENANGLSSIRTGKRCSASSVQMMHYLRTSQMLSNPSGRVQPMMSRSKSWVE